MIPAAALLAPSLRAARRRRHHFLGASAVRGCPAVGLAAILLLASAGAEAQAQRNGPEWGGMNHQPTQGQVVQRERRAGVRPPPAQVQQDDRSVQQLDRQLLHNEAVDPPRNPGRPTPP